MRTIARFMPPGWALLLLLLPYVGTIVFAYAISFALTGQLSWPAEIGEQLSAALILPAVAYGGWRAYCFHPLFHEEYSDWLVRSPWRFDRPLPVGPVGLAWQDAVVVATLAVLAELHSPSGALGVWSGFTIAYVTMLVLTAAMTNQRASVYAVWFLIALLNLLSPWPWLVLFDTLALQLVGWFAMRISLRSFPWEGINLVGKVRNLGNAQRLREVPVGWPFDRLGTRIWLSREVPLFDAVAVSALVAWSFFVIFIPEWRDHGTNEQTSYKLLLQFIAVPSVLARLAIYFWGGLWPPISLRGRLMTGRWLIPAFDYALLAPALMLLISLLAVRFINGTGPLSIAAHACALFVVLAIGLGMGPRYREWVLTAPGRIVGPYASHGPLKRL